MSELPDDIYLELCLYLSLDKQCMLRITAHRMTELVDTPLLREYRQAKGSLNIWDACDHKHLQLASWILKNKVISFPTHHMLKYFVKNGRDELSIIYLSKYSYTLNAIFEYGILATAAKYKANAFLRWFLENTELDEYLISDCLVGAIKSENMEIIDALLSHKNLPARLSAHLDLACTYGHLDVVKKISSVYTGSQESVMNYIKSACLQAHWDVVNYLLEIYDYPVNWDDMLDSIIANYERTMGAADIMANAVKYIVRTYKPDITAQNGKRILDAARINRELAEWLMKRFIKITKQSVTANTTTH